MESISNSDLFEVWRDTPKETRHAALSRKIVGVCNLGDLSDEMRKTVNKFIRLICLEIQRKWDRCGRGCDKFLKKHGAWLMKSIKLPDAILNNIHGSSGNQRGRPQVPFEKASFSTKKRRVADIINLKSSSEIAFAAHLTSQNETSTVNHLKKMSSLRALALYMDLRLSFRKYNILRSTINKYSPNLLPSYYVLKNTQQELLPSIHTSEIHAKINFQELLEKTVISILKIIDISISRPVKLICKWGFDGSSGHSRYKQRFNQSSENTDEFLFLSAFVPLQLIDNNQNVLWENPTPSSTLFCRPLKFIFEKESSLLVESERTRMEGLINNMISSTVVVNGNTWEISYCMFFTMIDGSVCNIISGTNSTQVCYICGATPKLMNKESVINLTSNIEYYKYGLSSLHCWIRSFECLLHIAYRLPLKTWQVRGDAAKQIFAETKCKVQKAFKEKMGLLVDIPKPGFGSTNDGNTARRFFENPGLSNEITGINISLIVNLGTILKVISSGKEINLQKFKTLINETKKIYLENYSWYYMPISLHKLLIHGPEIISFFVTPIGQLSEEALEGRHKDVRYFREHHTRKTSRCDTNMDLMKMLFLSSDPYLSYSRKNTYYKKKKLDETVIEYLVLKDNDLPTSLDSSDSDEDVHT